MFVDCPAPMTEDGLHLCGLPAAVVDRYTLDSTDGPIEHMRIECPWGHWFNGSVESLTRRAA